MSRFTWGVEELMLRAASTPIIEGQTHWVVSRMNPTDEEGMAPSLGVPRAWEQAASSLSLRQTHATTEWTLRVQKCLDSAVSGMVGHDRTRRRPPCSRRSAA